MEWTMKRKYHQDILSMNDDWKGRERGAKILREQQSSFPFNTVLSSAREGGKGIGGTPFILQVTLRYTRKRATI